MRTTSLLALAAATTALATGSHDGMAKQRRAHSQAAKRGNGWKLDTYAEVSLHTLRVLSVDVS